MADVISVSELNHYVKTLLDVNDGLFDLALRGEIANFVQNARRARSNNPSLTSSSVLT